jgi:prepilin-type N-terminal cleavage/methylation domain-containing protein
MAKLLIRQHKQAGFTLLEVIVALTITGFVLGSLFSLLGGSKQLTWRSEASLIEATRLRAATNFALLEDEYVDVEPILEDDSFEIRSIDILEEPVRKTQASPYTLEEYEILNSDRDIIITGSRWIQLELAR